MKKLSHLASSALLCGALAAAPLAIAQDTQSPTQQTDPQTQGQMQQATKIFVGTISKEGENCVLKDTATNVTYQLDDQAKAKKYLGKDVKVTGSFDANSNTIHVEMIEPAS